VEQIKLKHESLILESKNENLDGLGRAKDMLDTGIH
jgi:hypothetical protein